MPSTICPVAAVEAGASTVPCCRGTASGPGGPETNFVAAVRDEAAEPFEVAAMLVITPTITTAAAIGTRAWPRRVRRDWDWDWDWDCLCLCLWMCVFIRSPQLGATGARWAQHRVLRRWDDSGGS